jgi:hypothetical protein
MKLSGGLKSSPIVAALGRPHGENNPHPQIGEGTNRHRMAFALGPFAPIVVQRPWLTQGRLPGKQVERIAQGLQTGGAAVRFLVGATLVEHRGRASERLHTSGVGVPSAIISPFCQQPGSESFPCSGQALKDRAVGVSQKKGLRCPCRRRRSVRAGAAVGQPTPAASALSCWS